MPSDNCRKQYCPGVILFSYRYFAISILSINCPSSSFFAFLLLLYPLFLLIIRSTRASSVKEISSVTAFALRRRVWKVVKLPCSARTVSSVIHPAFFRTSIRFFLRSLYRCRLRRILLFCVLSAFVVILFPDSKLFRSSTDNGFTLTPSRTIEDFSSLFSASFTTAQPMELVPRSSPNIFLIGIMCYRVVFTIKGRKRADFRILFQT